MSDLEGLSVSDAKEINCLRCHKLVNIAGTREKLLISFVHHLAEDHKQDGHGVLLEHEDFEIISARLRCDLCMTIAEPPYWTYVTPRAPVEDEGWLACTGCKDLIEDPFGDKLERLSERSFQQQSSMLVMPPEGIARAGIRRSLETFLAYKRGKPTQDRSS